MLQSIDIVLPRSEADSWSWNNAVVYGLAHEWVEKANFVVLLSTGGRWQRCAATRGAPCALRAPGARPALATARSWRRRRRRLRWSACCAAASCSGPGQPASRLGPARTEPPVYAAALLPGFARRPPADMLPGPNWLAGMLHDLDRRGTAVAGAHSKVLHTSGKIKHAGYKWGSPTLLSRAAAATPAAAAAAAAAAAPGIRHPTPHTLACDTPATGHSLRPGTAASC
jgi:hypothetical protein